MPAEERQYTVIPIRVKPIKLILSEGEYLLTSSQPLNTPRYFGSVQAIQGVTAGETHLSSEHPALPGKGLVMATTLFIPLHGRGFYL